MRNNKGSKRNKWKNIVVQQFSGVWLFQDRGKHSWQSNPILIYFQIILFPKSHPMWVLETEIGSSVRAVCALNHLSISLGHIPPPFLKMVKVYKVFSSNLKTYSIFLCDPQLPPDNGPSELSFPSMT